MADNTVEQSTATIVAERDAAIAALVVAQEEAAAAESRARAAETMKQQGPAIGIPVADSFPQQPDVQTVVYIDDPRQIQVAPDPLTGAQAVYNLSENEVTLFSYQWTVKILAAIDFVFTLLNLTTFASNPHGADSAFWWALTFSLVMLFGPVFGYIGAAYLIEWAVFVYVLFVVIKTVYQVVLFIWYPYFWLMFCAVVQVWILAIVSSFFWALHAVPQARLETIKEDGFFQRAIRAQRGQRAQRFMFY